MSKFLAITIAAVLILSLFLTVFSIEDKISSDDPDATTMVTPSSASATAQTTAAVTEPSSGIEADVYIDPSGDYGYSIVGDTAFFFAKLDYSDVEFMPACVRFQAHSGTFQGVTYEPNVRVSHDGKLWQLPDEEGSSGCMSYLYSSIYVSYHMSTVADKADAQEKFAAIKEYILTNEEYFKVYLDFAEGDPTATGAN